MINHKHETLIDSLPFAERAGLTYRQLDHWTRNEILVPEYPAEGSGTVRKWSLSELRIACILKQFADLGMGWAAMKLVATKLRDTYLPTDGFVIVELTGHKMVLVRVTTDNSTNGPAWVARIDHGDLS